MYVRGDSLVVGRQLHHDFVEPPSTVQIDDSLAKEYDAIQALQLYQLPGPVIENGNQFTVYAVRTHTMDKVRLGYVKVFSKQPTAAHVMMAYHIGKHSGSCDDGEFKAGGAILKLIRSKNLKNVAIYVTRVMNGQRLGQKRFELIDQVVVKMLDFLLVSSVVDGPQAPPSDRYHGAAQ